MSDCQSPLRRPLRKKNRIPIEKVAMFLSKTQGRDKMCKVIQYLFRLIAAYYMKKDSYEFTKYTALTEATKDARKIFRLFKSVNEFKGMTYILFNQKQSLTNVLKIVSRVCFFFYWAFDNVSILSKCKLFSLDFERLYKIGYSFWFFALISMNLTLVYELFIEDKKSRIGRKMSQMSIQSFTDVPLICSEEFKFQIQKKASVQELTDCQKKQIRKEKLLFLMKHSFDILPSGKDSGILKIIFNRTVPEQVVGLCGFMSACLSVYQVIEEINKGEKVNDHI